VRRLIVTALLLCLAAFSASAATLAHSDGAAAQVPLPLPPAPPAPVPPVALPAPQHVLKVGDTLRIEGAAMGCQVTRRGGRPVLECRRDGALRGTYGTFMSERSLTVARFRSPTTAQTILTAKHGGAWRACRRAARSSHTASASRRCR
jgi:hypothetical protein